MTRVVTAVLLCIGLWASSTVANTQTLSVATTEYPPFYGESLENKGFMTEIIQEAMNRAGFDIEITFLPWKRAMAGAESGKFDGLYTMWYRPDREASFEFSTELPANEQVFIKRKDADIAFTSLEDLKPFTIGMVRGFAPPDGFNPDEFRTSLGNTDEDNLKKLIRGRIDLVVTDKIVAQHILNTTLKSSGDALEVLDPPLGVEPQYFVVSKQSPDFETTIAKFNDAIASMQSDGKLTAIMAKHGF